MPDDAPVPPVLPKFAEWAEQWRDGNETKAAEIMETIKQQVAEPAQEPAAPVALSLGNAPSKPNTITMHPVAIEMATKAPIDTYSEMQCLYMIAKNMVATLLVDSEQKGKIAHSLPTWMKEARTLITEIHKMSAGFQEKVALKKMDVAVAVISSSSELQDKFKIEMIKELEQMEMLSRKPKVVQL